MNVSFVLAFLLASGIAVAAIPLHERIHNENGWYVPQEDGNFKWMDLKEAEKILELGIQTESRAPVAVDFYLFTKSNPTVFVKINATDASIRASPFNKNHATRFIIHGWTGRHTDNMNTIITKAWLSRGDHNIIVVEWKRARSFTYAPSVAAVPATGNKVGEMIKYLHDSHGMSLDNLIVIGHSLGAHVAGYAGRFVGRGRIHSIVGLDPAMPFFRLGWKIIHLNSEDAFYVESIHTNGDWLAFHKPIGKAAFYPNGGKKQPGCGTDMFGKCSHSRATIYYAEAVTNNSFGSIRCQEFKNLQDNDCGSIFSDVRMGDDSNALKANGTFYVPVNSEPPYGNNLKAKPSN